MKKRRDGRTKEQRLLKQVASLKAELRLSEETRESATVKLDRLTKQRRNAEQLAERLSSIEGEKAKLEGRCSLAERQAQNEKVRADQAAADLETAMDRVTRISAVNAVVMRVGKEFSTQTFDMRYRLALAELWFDKLMPEQAGAYPWDRLLDAAIARDEPSEGDAEDDEDEI